MQFDSGKPIYQQIIDCIKTRIITGALRSGEKILPVRELALEMGVNPNTMQRALGQLEQEGLLRTERTSGKYVTENMEVVDKMKKEMLTQEIERFFSAMAAMGFTAREIKELVVSYESDKAKQAAPEWETRENGGGSQ